jgi:transcriptional regulator with XRE-family HTH domain
MDMEKAVGAELQACRRKKQISQEQLAFDAAIHRTYVSMIERGVKSPTLGVLFRLCQALDVPPAKFVRNVQLRMEKRDE